MARLIDADALKEQCFKFADDVPRSAMAFAQGQINCAPTIDAEPVKHGRWIKHEGYDECNLCHTKTIFGRNYCSNCGAKMEEEQ